jgi:VirB8 protein
VCAFDSQNSRRTRYTLTIDPIVVRQNWLQAYDYCTDKGAATLNDYARMHDPFARIGQNSTAAEISSVVRASESSFQVRWTERSFANGTPAGTERWTAVLSIVLQAPRTEERLRKNPLGIYVNGLAWSQELNATEGVRHHEYVDPTLRCSVHPDGHAGLSGCATRSQSPPTISLDEPPLMAAAQVLPEPPKPIEVVEVPKLLPLPAQMKSLANGPEDKPMLESVDEKTRVARANAEARVAPSREGYVNAIQVWPYADGALYQVYTSPGRVTVIALQ